MKFLACNHDAGKYKDGIVCKDCPYPCKTCNLSNHAYGGLGTNNVCDGIQTKILIIQLF